MKLFSKVVAGVFLGSVLAALPITYIERYGMDPTFHAFAATIAGLGLVFASCVYLGFGE